VPSLSLRAKFLLSLVLISGLITTSVLVLVRYRVEVRARADLAQALGASVTAFNALQAQREQTLERSAALLAALPPLKALMTSGDGATIQDASTAFWDLAGSEVFVLAGMDGRVSAFHARAAEFPREAAQAAVRRYFESGATRDWWYGGGRLYQVFLQPISFGASDSGVPIGLVAVGYEVNERVAQDIRAVADSDVGFAYDGHLVVSTLGGGTRDALAALLGAPQAPAPAREVVLEHAAYVMTTERLSAAGGPAVSIAALKSFDVTAQFLDSLNRWIVAIGVIGVMAGALLVYLVSTTFTRPLERLVHGVKALEQGDYAFPLDERGGDEVATLTTAFARMREQLQAQQRQLIEAERMATIGRMANTISHDLRHPLTAIQAYAEFLESPDLAADKRQDFSQEIRIAVNHMLDELNQLLGFSHERKTITRVDGHLDDVVERAVRTVKALPEFEALTITSHVGSATTAWFDPGKVERVLLNLLFNAAEAVPAQGGHIDVTATPVSGGVDVRVIDNGPGIPEAIAGTLFEPFVSHGKQKGTGLGLTVVQTVMQQHGGSAVVEHTGPSGTTFLLRFPAKPANA
jgi:signal transduction histidine kinase